MSELGVFAVDRGVFNHPLLTSSDPYSRREAWLWLVSEAAWKPRKVGRAGAVIDLERGQLAHSVRFMADAWGWSKSSVDRFLTRLKTGTMIGTQAGTGVIVITICKYNEYQRVGLPDRDTDRDTNRDRSGTAPGQTRNIQAFKEDLLSEAKASDDIATSRKRKAYTAEYEAAWKAYPTTPNMSKSEGLAQWAKLTPDERAAVQSSIPAYIAFLKSKPSLEVVHFCRYLSQRRFEGHAQAVTVETDTVWQTRLSWARKRLTWPVDQWGPAPGQPGCRVPSALLADGDDQLAGTEQAA